MIKHQSVRCQDDCSPGEPLLSDLLLTPTISSSSHSNHNTKTSSWIFQIAVLYAKPGQTSIDQIWKNRPPKNSGFYHFLDGIADQIDVSGFTGYKGDMGSFGQGSHQFIHSCSKLELCNPNSICVQTRRAVRIIGIGTESRSSFTSRPGWTKNSIADSSATTLVLLTDSPLSYLKL